MTCCGVESASGDNVTFLMPAGLCMRLSTSAFTVVRS
jgi:hypothetical protein